MPESVKIDVRAEAAADYAGVFRGRPAEVSRARGAVARYLAACPVADDVVLIASELAAAQTTGGLRPATQCGTSSRAKAADW